VPDIDDTELPDQIDPALISDSQLLPDPDPDSFQTILQDEFGLARVQRLERKSDGWDSWAMRMPHASSKL
jgi:hypothetical protein